MSTNRDYVHPEYYSYNGDEDSSDKVDEQHINYLYDGVIYLLVDAKEVVLRIHITT